MNRATRKEYLTGRNGYYETDQVKGVASDINAMTGYGKTDQSFLGGMTGEQMVGSTNYHNPMNNLHNNIGTTALVTQNMDNKIFIDAEFRDTSYIDSKNQPFKFTVRFKESEAMPNTELITLDYNGNIYEYHRYKKGGREIVFPYVYHNVNFIIIDSLIMPTYIEYETQKDGSIVSILCREIVRTERYLVLKIEQLQDYKKVSNNPNLGDKCFIMKNDDTSGINHQFYIPIHDQITAFQSQLPTIDRLDIEICNRKGKKLIPTLDGAPHNFHRDYQDSIEELRVELNKPPECRDMEKINALEKRLLSLHNIVSCIDPEIHLTVNNVNQQINTDIKYRR